MNAKNLIILTIITAIVVIAAVVSVRPPTQEGPNDKQLVFPKLGTSLQEVTEIQMATKEETFTIERRGEQWTLKEKHNYPIALEKVRNLLFGLADLVNLEEKTNDPTRYAKIGVEELTEKDAKSTLLTLKKGQELLAKLIVGNSRPAKIDSTRQEIYIRKPEDKQAWLALGSLSLEKKSSDWLDKQLFELTDHQRVRQVTVTQADGYQFQLLKDSKKDEQYKLAKIPTGMNVKVSPYDLTQIAGLLANLNVTDVRPEKEVEFKKDASTTAVLSTFDGLEVTIQATAKEGKYYAKFDSKFVPPPAQPKKETKKEAKKEDAQDKPQDESKKEEKSEADVKKEVETAKTKTSGWVFEIPQYKYNLLVKKESDLFEAPKPASENGTPSTMKLDGNKLKLDHSKLDLMKKMPKLNIEGQSK